MNPRAAFPSDPKHSLHTMNKLTLLTAIAVSLGLSSARLLANDEDDHHARDHAKAEHDDARARQNAQHVRDAAHRASHTGNYEDIHHAQHDAQKAAGSNAKAHDSRHHAEDHE